METAVLLAKQLLIMFTLMFMGFIMAKTKKVTPEGNKSISNLLLYIVLPLTVINSFDVERTSKRTEELLISLCLSVLLLLAAMLTAALIFKKHPISNFGAAFSNAGFIGLPLISATLGYDAVFYIAGFAALLNALQWTYGQVVLKEEKLRLTWEMRKSIIQSPIVIAFVLGLVRYFLPVSLPEMASSVISAVAACNAPMAMFILGFYLSRIEIKKGMINSTQWLTCGVRLLLIPAISMLLLSLFPGVSREIRMALLIVAAAPVGSNVSIYAQQLGKDYRGATINVCLSTLLSLISMPLLIMAAGWIWK